MSNELYIYEQQINTVNEKRVITLTETAKISNPELIELLIFKAQRGFYMSSECGAIFEMSGSTLTEVLNEFNESIQLDNNTYYRCECSF